MGAKELFLLEANSPRRITPRPRALKRQTFEFAAMNDAASPLVTRRHFVKTTAVAGAALATALPARVRAQSPSNKIVVGVMGLGRGFDLARSSGANENVEIGYICDIDDTRFARAQKAVTEKQGKEPRAVKDFRRILDDKDVDVLMVAAPNHWHAPATILACSAGKHVYVEKPASHNPNEAELMVAAARKNNRVVQMGNQRRSWPALIEAVEKLRAGAIGRVLFARCWYNNLRPSIGRGTPAAVPANMDYTLWQGPAPDRPYKSNLIHYNWHWHWHWGNGELGNNGVHAIDVARWGLGVDHALRITSNGGRYHYQDDQETPDTNMVTYDFGEKGISWEGSSCHPRPGENLAFVTFYGEGGSLANHGAGYKIYDLKGKEIGSGSGSGGEQGHIANFLDAIRTGKRPNSEIEDAQKSAMLCHLGNIAYRVGRTVHFDPATRRIVNDPEAMALWAREYRPGWEPKI
jgi:predicted dehydrogenase